MQNPPYSTSDWLLFVFVLSALASNCLLIVLDWFFLWFLYSGYRAMVSPVNTATSSDSSFSNIQLRNGMLASNHATILFRATAEAGQHLCEWKSQNLYEEKTLQLHVKKPLSSCLSYRLFITFLPKKEWRWLCDATQVASCCSYCLWQLEKMTVTVSPADRDFGELSHRKHPPSPRVRQHPAYWWRLCT